MACGRARRPGGSSVSGEATSKSSQSAEPLERACGPEAACNRCGARVRDYRVVATFLHQTAAVRAYCRDCYPQASEGEYFAAGDGLVLDYARFADRFGAPGPAPPPVTPVDRMLARLVRDPALVSLAPWSEAGARRQGTRPYRFRIACRLEARVCAAELSVSPNGDVASIEGEDAAREWLRSAIATP